MIHMIFGPIRHLYLGHSMISTPNDSFVLDTRSSIISSAFPFKTFKTHLALLSSPSNAHQRGPMRSFLAREMVLVLVPLSSLRLVVTFCFFVLDDRQRLCFFLFALF